MLRGLERRVAILERSIGSTQHTILVNAADGETNEEALTRYGAAGKIVRPTDLIVFVHSFIPRRATE
ncbi:MAG: hypothetical protein AB7I34_26130 [Rhizobiaceae bacterium]